MNEPSGAALEILPYDGSALLYAGFICAVDADVLMNDLASSVPWESTRIPMFGREVTEPRLSAWIADPGVTYRYSGRDRTVHPWSARLDDVRRHVGETSGTSFNGVLANLYRTGHDHMGWHSDDERSLGPVPVIASVSLGAERRFDFRHRETGEVVSILLPHGSLLVMSGATQRRWKHRIPKSTRLSEPRINLTFRRLV